MCPTLARCCQGVIDRLALPVSDLFPLASSRYPYLFSSNNGDKSRDSNRVGIRPGAVFALSDLKKLEALLLHLVNRLSPAALGYRAKKQQGQKCLEFRFHYWSVHRVDHHKTS